MSFKQGPIEIKIEMEARTAEEAMEAWIADVESGLSSHLAGAEVAQWKSHCIYRVPAHIKRLNAGAYKPQVASLGPFHHGEPDLLPMEEHKRRAVVHLVNRTGKPLREFVAAVDAVAEELERAYKDLGDGWTGPGGRGRFLQVMLTDGCFLLEVMRAAAGELCGDYAHNDPIFSPHGVLYACPFIRRDMLMIENQLPQLVLQRIVAVETGKPSNDDFISRTVLRFLSSSSRAPPAFVGLGLHPLEVLRSSMLFGPYQIDARSYEEESDIIRPAVELYEAGVRFKRSKTASLRDIRFRHGVLTMPQMPVDDSTESMFLNMMAFERLHAGAGNDVTAYVFFMDNIIGSAKDVALLSSKGIIQNAMGSDKAVAKFFNSICRDVVIEPDSELDAVQRQVNRYCSNGFRRTRNKYFRRPWTAISLFAATVLLTLVVLQTIYAIRSFYERKSE